ncbi:FmdB family zinc ribbon protein [Methylocaldum sp. MU1018]
MPTYDYQCKACKHEFTAMHKISEAAPKCPDCGGEVRKKLSAPAVHGASAGKEAAIGAGHGCGMGACGCKH